MIDREIIPCDTVILAIGQDNAFPWIERDIGLEFDKWDMPVVDKTTFMSTRPGVFFGGDAAFGPENIIWAVEHGHQAAISIHNHCQGMPVTERPPQGMKLASTKMGLHEWSYSNDYNPAQRQKMQHVELPSASRSMTIEVEQGFTAEQTRAEVERCLNCDIETHFTDSLCIECDACVDICPVDCLTITPNADEPELRDAPARPGRQSRAAAVRVRAAEADQPRHGQGRGRLPALRPVRRALPDVRVGHAEVRAADSVRGARGRHPCRRVRRRTQFEADTSARRERARRSGNVELDGMDRINDFAFKIATVNGTGSASANGLIMQAIFRMGIPVTGKNVFPSNIQGLPTWYEIRVNKDGYTARTPDFDLMVAHEPGDLREGRRGGALRRLPAVRLDLAARPAR